MKSTKFIRPTFEIEKHMLLICEISLLLKNDGREDLYHLLNSTVEGGGITYRELLEKGTRDADVPFSGGYIFHAFHFHHPWTHRGYLTARSSADDTARYFALAVKLWQAGDKAAAIYQLGRSIHLVQDIFVPHHAGVTAFHGHGQLEKWLTRNWKPYQVTHGGYYHWDERFTAKDGTTHRVRSESPYDWIDFGSHLSHVWYEKYFRCKRFNEDTFHKVAAKIVPNVLRHNAGYLNKFFQEVGL